MPIQKMNQRVVVWRTRQSANPRQTHCRAQRLPSIAGECSSCNPPAIFIISR